MTPRPLVDWIAPLGLALLATAVTLIAPQDALVAWLLVIAAWVWAIGTVRRERARSRGLEESVVQLYETVDRWAGGDLASRVYLDTDDPLDPLAHGMNRVAEVLDERTQDLIRDKERLEAILTSMANGIIIFDRALYITLINRAALDLFGVTEDQAVGHHVLEAIRATAVENALLKVTRLGQAAVIEWAPDPRQDALIECSMAPVGQVGGGFGAVLVARDITAQRRLDRMRSDFVANVSHELQTPLTTIIGFAEALSDEVPPDPEDARRFIGLIHEEARRLSRLVDDLLALSRLEHHSLPSRRHAVALSELVDDVVLQLRGRAETQGLSLSADAGRAAFAWGDRDLLREVLLNLVSNSIQYTPEGGHIVVTVRTSANEVRIMVEDDGIGIPSQDLPRIFERFYRVDKDRSRRSGGTGLGLAIVKHIVEFLHGSIRVASELNRGSTFTVVLPRAPEPGADPVRDSEEA